MHLRLPDSHKMKVLLFGQHFSEYVLTFSSGFNHDIDYCLILSSENFRSEVTQSHCHAGERLHLVNMPGPKKIFQFLSSLYIVHRLLRRTQPDIVHFQEMPKGFTFLCWLLSRSTRRILTIHDITSHPGQDSTTSVRQEYIKNYMRRTAHSLIVHGEQLSVQLAELDPAFSRKAFVVPHPAMRTVPAIAARQPTNRILFFGRIAKYKGLRYLIDACLKLQDREIAFTLVIAGQGDDFEIHRPLLRQIKSTQILNRYIEPSEINAIFADADIVAIPYIEASQSGIAAYALGFGKPCVATRTGSLPEVVRDQYNGLLCPPENSEELANCIQRLLTDPVMLRTLGENAYRLANGPFSPTEVAQSTAKVYGVALR
jgi:glycosyltransferase involved in cell wall biosynthesis